MKLIAVIGSHTHTHTHTQLQVPTTTTDHPHLWRNTWMSYDLSAAMHSRPLHLSLAEMSLKVVRGHSDVTSNWLPTNIGPTHRLLHFTVIIVVNKNITPQEKRRRRDQNNCSQWWKHEAFLLLLIITYVSVTVNELQSQKFKLCSIIGHQAYLSKAITLQAWITLSVSVEPWLMTDTVLTTLHSAVESHM